MKRIFLFLILGAFALSLKAPQGYTVGSIASDFSLKNASNTVNGIDAKVSLKDYKNAKGYIVIFTCNHCPYSKAYEDRIIELHKKFDPKGFPVVAINPNDPERVPEDSYKNMKVRAKEKKFPFAYLHDDAQEIAKGYGATRTPHVFLLVKETKGGKTKNVVRYIGAIDNDSWNAEKASEKYVEDAINAVMQGESINKTNVKAVGCTIKWKES